MNYLKCLRNFLYIISFFPICFILYALFFYTSSAINHFRTTDDFYGTYFFLPETYDNSCVSLEIKHNFIYIQKYYIDNKLKKLIMGRYTKTGRNINFDEYIFRSYGSKNIYIGGLTSYLYRDYLGRYSITSDEDPDSDNNYKKVRSLDDNPFCRNIKP